MDDYKKEKKREDTELKWFNYSPHTLLVVTHLHTQ